MNKTSFFQTLSILLALFTSVFWGFSYGVFSKEIEVTQKTYKLFLVLNIFVLFNAVMVLWFFLAMKLQQFFPSLQKSDFELRDEEEYYNRHNR
jgi:formate/nitrite transporter FocA (FNT family)